LCFFRPEGGRNTKGGGRSLVAQESWPRRHKADGGQEGMPWRAEERERGAGGMVADESWPRRHKADGGQEQMPRRHKADGGQEGMPCRQEGDGFFDVHARPRRTVLQRTVLRRTVIGTHGLGGPCYGGMCCGGLGASTKKPAKHKELRVRDGCRFSS